MPKSDRFAEADFTGSLVYFADEDGPKKLSPDEEPETICAPTSLRATSGIFSTALVSLICDQRGIC